MNANAEARFETAQLTQEMLALEDYQGFYRAKLAARHRARPIRPDTRLWTAEDIAAVEKHGVKAEGSGAAASAKVLAELLDLIARERLEVPIARVYPLAEVRAAFHDLAERHTLGKIVLRP